jgi:hypothetical protein
MKRLVTDSREDISNSPATVMTRVGKIWLSQLVAIFSTRGTGATIRALLSPCETRSRLLVAKKDSATRVAVDNTSQSWER